MQDELVAVRGREAQLLLLGYYPDWGGGVPDSHHHVHALMHAPPFDSQNAEAEVRECGGVPLRKSRRTAARAALVGLFPAIPSRFQTVAAGLSAAGYFAAGS